MKTLILLLLCSTFAFAQTIEERVKKFEKPKSYSVEYDKFEKQTRVEYLGLIEGPKRKGGWLTGGSPYLAFQASVFIKSDGEVWYLFFFEPQYRTLYNHDRLRFLLDGNLLDIKDETEIEYYASFVITPEEFNKIISAKTVEMQLRGFEATLDAKTMTALRNLASLTKPAP